MQIGTQVTDHLVETMTEKELQQAEETWKRYTSAYHKGLNVPDYDMEG